MASSSGYRARCGGRPSRSCGRSSELAWSIQVRGAGDILAGSGRERVELPTIDLEALFANSFEAELANGNHDAAFSPRFAEIGLTELRAAQAQVAADVANEDA